MKLFSNSKKITLLSPIFSESKVKVKTVISRYGNIAVCTAFLCNKRKKGRRRRKKSQILCWKSQSLWTLNVNMTTMYSSHVWSFGFEDWCWKEDFKDRLLFHYCLRSTLMLQHERLQGLALWPIFKLIYTLRKTCNINKIILFYLRHGARRCSGNFFSSAVLPTLLTTVQIAHLTSWNRHKNSHDTASTPGLNHNILIPFCESWMNSDSTFLTFLV